MNENTKLAKAMEQELLAFFEQDKVKKELLKFAISDVKMVKEYGGDKAEYLALFEEQGSDKTSLEESGVSYPLQERLSKETYEKYLTTVEEADDIYSELGEEIYNKFFEHTLDETEKQYIREYYDETYGMEVSYIKELFKETIEE